VIQCGNEDPVISAPLNDSLIEWSGWTCRNMAVKKGDQYLIDPTHFPQNNSNTNLFTAANR
jgi:hypothetical protein